MVAGIAPPITIAPTVHLQSSTQYESVWSVPLKDKVINDPDAFFSTNSEEHKPLIKEVSIDRERIRKAIMRLKNNAAPGPDGIPVSFLKTFVDYIVEPLEIIYRNSIESKIFPRIWKLMHITPIRKPGKPKSLPSSYRPVGLTSHLGKVLESVVKDQLHDFIETYGLLSENQHGFRKRKSCISQLLIHSEMIMKALENGNNLD